MHPEYDGWENDIALIHLDEAPVGVTPYPLYAGSDESGQLISIVGRGVTATGLEGERNGVSDGQLRRATNVIASVDSQWLGIFFEAPGEENITALKGVGAAGDSGCPVFLETDDGLVIVGINSWGEGEGSIRVGQYGAWDYQTRISQFSSWIDDGIANAGSVPVTEPEEKSEAGCSNFGSFAWPNCWGFLAVFTVLRRRSRQSSFC